MTTAQHHHRHAADRRRHQGLLPAAPRLAARHRLRAEPDQPGRAAQAAGRQASIQFGEGTGYSAGPPHDLFLVVDDIVAAREDLVARGVEISQIWHIEPGQGRVEKYDSGALAQLLFATVRRHVATD